MTLLVRTISNLWRSPELPPGACDLPIKVAIQQGAQAIELRADQFDDLNAVEEVLRRPHEVPYIVTIRTKDQGGGWEGDDAERIALFEHLGLLHPGYVDVEFETWKRSANLRQKIGLVCELRGEDAGDLATRRPRNQLILSHHDFRGFPDDAATRLAEMAATPATIIKLAVMCEDAHAALRLMELQRKHAGRGAVVIGMGANGRATRILAPKTGARLAYASGPGQERAAPGMLTLRALIDDYRWGGIGERTPVFGVVGWPVEHSLSPILHNHAMQQMRRPGVYVPLPVRPTWEAFRDFMEAVTDAQWLDLQGVSVTLPHKEHALRFALESGGTASELAAECGAANTLTWETGWHAENTDALGLEQALRARGEWERLSWATVDVLGAGGMAAAAASVLRASAGRVRIRSRSPERARRLAKRIGCDYADWPPRELGSVVINCTPVGMTPDVDASPCPIDELRPEMLVVETIYNPRETLLLKEARARGCRTLEGLDLFVAQGLAQFERWHGAKPDPGGVRKRLETALEERLEGAGLKSRF